MRPDQVIAVIGVSFTIAVVVLFALTIVVMEVTK